MLCRNGTAEAILEGMYGTGFPRPFNVASIILIDEISFVRVVPERYHTIQNQSPPSGL